MGRKYIIVEEVQSSLVAAGDIEMGGSKGGVEVNGAGHQESRISGN